MGGGQIPRLISVKRVTEIAIRNRADELATQSPVRLPGDTHAKLAEVAGKFGAPLGYVAACFINHTIAEMEAGRLKFEENHAG